MFAHGRMARVDTDGRLAANKQTMEELCLFVTYTEVGIATATKELHL